MGSEQSKTKKELTPEEIRQLRLIAIKQNLDLSQGNGNLLIGKKEQKQQFQNEKFFSIFGFCKCKRKNGKQPEKIIEIPKTTLIQKQNPPPQDITEINNLKNVQEPENKTKIIKTDQQQTNINLKTDQQQTNINLKTDQQQQNIILKTGQQQTTNNNDSQEKSNFTENKSKIIQDKSVIGNEPGNQPLDYKTDSNTDQKLQKTDQTTEQQEKGEQIVLKDEIINNKGQQDLKNEQNIQQRQSILGKDEIIPGMQNEIPIQQKVQQQNTDQNQLQIIQNNQIIVPIKKKLDVKELTRYIVKQLNLRFENIENRDQRQQQEQQQQFIFDLTHKKSQFHNKVLETMVLDLSNISDVLNEILNSSQSNFSNDVSLRIEYLYQLIEKFDYQQDRVEQAIEIRDICINYIRSLIYNPFIFFGQEIVNKEKQQQIRGELIKRFYEIIIKDFRDSQSIIELILINEFDDSKDEIIYILQGIYNYQLILINKMTIYPDFHISSVLQFLNTITFLDTKILEWFLFSSGLFYIENIQTGKYVENHSVIGRLLKFSAFPHEGQALQIFDDINSQNEMNQRKINDKKRILSQNLDQIIDFIFEFLEKILNYKEIKYINVVFDLMEDLVKLNKPRGMMHFQNNNQLAMTVNSDGFNQNILKVLLKLFEKYQHIEKVNNIDTLIAYKRTKFFLNESNLVSLGENASQQKQEDENRRLLSNQDFIATKLYRIISAQMHITTGIIKDFVKLQQEIQKQHNNLQNQNAEQQGQFILLLKRKFCIEVQVLDSYTLKQSLGFLNFQAKFCLNLNKISVKDDDFEGQAFDIDKIPTTIEYSQIPILVIEYYTEWFDLHRYFNLEELRDKYNKNLFGIVNFLLLVMGEEKLCSNLHFRCKIIQVFARMMRSEQKYNDDLSFYWANNGLFFKYFMKYLIKIFVTSERTGTHAQFYEKFAFRLDFLKLFSKLIKNQAYVEKVQEIFQREKILILDFSSFYLNDIIFVFDDSLKNIKDLKILEDDLKSDNLQQQNRIEKETEYKQKKGMCRYFNELSNAYYENMLEISQYSREIFLQEEIVEKFARSLTNTIYQLNCENSVVEFNLDCLNEIKFMPRLITSTVIKSFINFKDSNIFLENIIKDQIGFDKQIFEKTIKTLEQIYLIDEQKMDEFKMMISKLFIMQEEFITFDNEISQNAPDEYLDALLSEIMIDPVKLPESGMVVDRITIKKHLANDKNDPFNRSPLQEDQLIEMPQLKQKIQNYIAEIKKNRLNNKSQDQKQQLQQSKY